MSANGRPEYQVRLRSRRVQREMDKLREFDYQRVLAGLKALAKNPRPQGSQKLADNIYRIRVGEMRVIYLVDEEHKRVDIGGIMRRGKSTYRGFEDLFG